MGLSLPELQQLLVRMHRSGQRGGLGEQAAVSLTEALAAGHDLQDVARRVGLDPRITQAVDASKTSDVPTALAEQARVASILESRRLRLRAAGTYPLVLAAAVMAAAVAIAGVMGPSLSGLSLEMPSMTVLYVAMGGVAGVLVLLSVVVLGQLRLPMIGTAWSRLHRAAFLESLAALCASDVLLSDALRASSVWCLPQQRRSALALAQQLDAGGDVVDGGAGALLEPAEESMLVHAARAGGAAAAAQAIAVQDAVMAPSGLLRDLFRIHVISIGIAGVGVLFVGLAFFEVYFHAFFR